MLRPALALFLLALPVLAQQPFALTGGTVHTGNGTTIPDAVVIVREGRIAAVGPRASVPVPAGMRTVDVKGRHLTPGLVDTHVHYSQTGWADGRPDAWDVTKTHPYTVAMADNAAHPERYHLAFLHAGVTAVFDCGGYPWTRTLGARTENDPRAPHVAAAGALLATFEVKPLRLPDQAQFVFPKTPDEARVLVRSHKAWGSDAIKIWLIVTAGTPTLEELTPIVEAAGDEAKQVGLPLIVHATELETARVAVQAGAYLLVHSVENTEVDDAFVAAVKERGTYYCPTLTVRAGYSQLYARKLSDEVRAQLDDVHPSVKERALLTESLPGGRRLNPQQLELNLKMFARQSVTMAKNLVRLHDAGVPVVLGTDAGNPLTLHGPSIFVELEAMQAAGLPASAVFVAATRDAARSMGRGKDLGQIAEGFVADLLVLAEDPEADVRAFRSLQQVCRAGQLHERAALLPR